MPKIEWKAKVVAIHESGKLRNDPKLLMYILALHFLQIPRIVLKKFAAQIENYLIPETSGFQTRQILYKSSLNFI